MANMYCMKGMQEFLSWRLSLIFISSKSAKIAVVLLLAWLLTGSCVIKQGAGFTNSFVCTVFCFESF